ncbi:hypothetical protein [Pseudodesulfovibrio karagichevae]|uniref:Uncharacterized protein n=1 Tax=Pseudodesulfovibrio karagichevae TaxID=3239305 RepID=A0ABV4K0M5_9BACT
MRLVTATDHIAPPVPGDEERYLSIIENQQRAIAFFREQIERMDPDGDALGMDSMPSTGASSKEELKKILDYNSNTIQLLLCRYSNQHQESWFELISRYNFSEHPCEDNNFMLPNIKLDDEISELLGLRDLQRVGTWGRYKVLVDTCDEPRRKNNKRALLIIHCNIHNLESRQENLEHVIGMYFDELKQRGVENVIVYSSNQFQTRHDEQAQRIHQTHCHWSPYSTALFASRVLDEYGDAIALSSPYIISHLLDNNLQFEFDSSLVIDDRGKLEESFRNILSHLDRKDGRG